MIESFQRGVAASVHALISVACLYAIVEWLGWDFQWAAVYVVLSCIEYNARRPR